MPRARTLPGVRSRDWAALQLAYETFEGDDLSGLAARHQITRKTLSNYAQAKKWRRFDAPPLPQAPTLLVPTTPAVVAPATRVTREALDALVVRLFNVTALKLYQLEVRMQENKPLSQADHERETRMIGSLTKNAEKVHELSRPTEGRADVAAKSGQTTGDDAERARRELKARLKSLRDASDEQHGGAR